MEWKSDYLQSRRQALRDQLAARRLRFLVVTHPPNIFYLTGFRGSAGAVIFGPADAVLLVDPRYAIQAREQAGGMEVREVKVALQKAVGIWLRKRRASAIAFEDAHTTVSGFQQLRGAGPDGARWAPAGSLIEDLRLVKDDWEIDQVRKACALTVAAFVEFLPQLRPGVTERDLAAELDFRARRMGAEGMAFETIVASGGRSAWPHARPSAKVVAGGEFVIFDLGAILGGYAADMTRTMYLGSPGRRVCSLYNSLLSAQEAGISSLRAGVSGGEVDAAVRRRLGQDQLSQYFTHSTGHGVGIEIHERPRLGKEEKSKIPARSVVTVEPGIYLEGFGGIRIEDTVLVAQDSVDVLTPAAKDRWFTG